MFSREPAFVAEIGDRRNAVERSEIGEAAVGADERARARHDGALQLQIVRGADSFGQVHDAMLVHADATMIINVQPGGQRDHRASSGKSRQRLLGERPIRVGRGKAVVEVELGGHVRRRQLRKPDGIGRHEPPVPARAGAPIQSADVPTRTD